MEPERREELTRWAESLTRSDVAELRAAGRAIRLLCTENEELARRLGELEARGNGGAPAEVLERGREQPRRERPRRERPRLERPPRRARTAPAAIPWRRVLAAVAIVAIVAAILTVAARAAQPELDASGPANGALVSAGGLRTLAIAAQATDAEWRLDGKPITPRRVGTRTVWRPTRLPDGEHVVEVRRSGRIFSATRTFHFTVDTRAPRLELAAPATVVRGRPLELKGRVEPAAKLRHGRSVVPLDATGAFRTVLDPSPRRLVVTATDAAGNSSRWRVPVTLVPRRPAQPIRSVHVTSHAWADDDLRAAILGLVRARKINAVQLDLKDESGEVGWASGVPLARSMGAQRNVYDLRKAVAQLHRMGVRVIGRLVCFRDPIHAKAAWSAGRRDEVIQAPGGAQYAKYGGFTNFASPKVRKYNIDVAVAAARLGVDEILYDYVRRPDGPLGSMIFPGIRETPERAIARFLAESRAALEGTDVLVGASVFGVAATRPTEVAQDIPAMAREVDYIAPMLYPSHWGPGEYNVANPNAQPYDIVRRSTADFVRQVRGTGARVVNWLQDFSLGYPYGANEVRAQIRASRDAGAGEFILWNAAATYTADALDPTARVPSLAEKATPPKKAPMPVRLPDPKPKPAAAPTKPNPQDVKRPLSRLPPNELGQIPVVMHHMIRPDRVGDYDQTPAEFRAELDYLWRKGYALVNVGDLVRGNIDVPAGTTPVAFTFDDATTYQIDFTPSGEIKPQTAVGIMLEFARTHPGFVPRGTFYVNRTPFGSRTNARRALRWLVRNGFEIGNHTHDHVPLRGLPDEEIRKQLATGAEAIHEILPGYKIVSMSLPLGSLPENERLVVQGGWRGKRYGPYAVVLVGANPAPSPYSKAFSPAAIPRIRTSHAGWKGEADFGFAYWMNQLERNPQARFVSDGDPRTITVRRGNEDDVHARFASRVQLVP